MRRSLVLILVALVGLPACSTGDPTAIDPVSCVDAADGAVPARDDAWGVLAVGADELYMVSPDLDWTELPRLLPADESVIVTGGDGRLWFSDGATGRFAALDPHTKVSSGLDLGEPVEATAPTAEGIAAVTDDELIELSGAPMTERRTELKGGGAGTFGLARGPDGVWWLEPPGELVAVSPEGDVLVRHEVPAPVYGPLLVGTACALLVEGCPTILHSYTLDGADEQRLGGGCAAYSAVHDGVLWTGHGEVARVDLASGEIRTSTPFHCGDGTTLLAGDGGVVALDDCDYAAARLDPATAEVLEKTDLNEMIVDIDSMPLGSWPWVSFEMVLMHLPSVVPTVVALDADPWEVGIIATVPPPSG